MGHQSMTTFETMEVFDQIWEEAKEEVPNRFNESLESERKKTLHDETDPLKMSTVYSYKGWEADIIQDTDIPEVVYTAFTRAKRNIFILNYDNDKYHPFFQKNIY